MVSHAGLTVRFREEDARAMGRDTTGVRGMDVSGKGNYLLAMDVARPGQDLLVVTENGYGKRTAIDEYRLTSRGAKGVKTIAFTESKGLLAAALVVASTRSSSSSPRTGWCSGPPCAGSTATAGRRRACGS